MGLIGKRLHNAMKALACFNALAFNGGKYPVSFSEDLQTFYGALARGLDKLDRSMSENFISFQWLKEALNLLKAMHSGVILLIEKLDLAVSLRGEEWLNDYMDETLKLLDICNALKVGISGLEHYHMVVELALMKLDGLEKIVPLNSRVLNALDACKEESQRVNAEKKKNCCIKEVDRWEVQILLERKELGEQICEMEWLLGCDVCGEECDLIDFLVSCFWFSLPSSFGPEFKL